MSGGKTHVRSRARSWTLQLLYAWDVAGEGELGEDVRHQVDPEQLHGPERLA